MRRRAADQDVEPAESALRGVGRGACLGLVDNIANPRHCPPAGFGHQSGRL
jgi:hypothetical protein